MKKSKTQRIEAAKEAVYMQLNALAQRELILRNRLQHLHNIAMQIDEPHAVIPKAYSTPDEWFNGHPFPESLINKICQNKNQAEEIRVSCNTYYFDYHVVPCQPVAYYREKYLNNEKR